MKKFLKRLLKLLDDDTTWFPNISSPIIELPSDVKSFNIFQRISWISINLLFYAWLMTIKLLDIKQKLSKKIFSKRLKIFSKLCINSWILFYKYLLKMENSNMINNNQIGEILIIAHDSLGRNGLCTGKKCNYLINLNTAEFLKLIINHMALLNDVQFQTECMQCYKCVYGINIKVAADNQLEDHENVTTEDFGKDSALLLFKVIEPFLMEKIENGTYRAITNDLRNCLQMVTKVFPNPPFDNHLINSNKNAINFMLDSDISVLEASPTLTQNLSVLEIFSFKDPNDNIFLKLFYIEAKIFLGHYISRTEKLSEWLLLACDKFLYHLSIKPFDSDAWISLGLCYWMMVSEKLSTCFLDNVTMYQKKAFHCFVRATKLISIPALPPVKNRQAEILWKSFAQLSLSIISKPMENEALKSDLRRYNSFRFISTVANKNNYNSKIIIEKVRQNMPQTVKSLRILISYSLKKSLKINPNNWETYFYLAHIYYKLRITPSTVIKLYFIGLSKCPRDFFLAKDFERGLSPLFKIINYLTKMVLGNFITVICI